MLVVETIARIRREYFVKGKPIKEIVRDVKVSGNTVRKVIRSQATAFTYDRRVQPMPKLGPWTAELERMLEANETKSKRERLTLLRISEALEGLGYGGGYDAVRRYAKAWRWRRSASTAQTYVPLVFSPGEAYQFDWSHEYVVLAGVTTKVKVAHVRLCHSRMFFVRAYPRESQGDGVRRPRPGIPAVPGCLPARHLRQHEDGGADRPHRQGARVQPALRADVWPLPGRTDSMHAGSGMGEGAGREPGRDHPRSVLHPAAALQDLRRAQRLALGPVRRLRPASSPPRCSRTGLSGRCSRDERPSLVGYRGPFDGFHAVPASVSKTCLVRFDSNKYSVAARAVGRPVEVHAYADRIVIRQDGEIVAEHARRFGRDQTVYDPWHYVPVLARKPGALRNGAPFKDWALPGALGRVRVRLAGHDDGDRQMVEILTAVLADGLAAVEAACAEALAGGVCSADVVLNILNRRRQPSETAPIPTPANLRLRFEPVADCTRYDRLRGVGHGAP